MRLFGYRITGISKKFFFVLGGLILLVVMLVTFWPSNKKIVKNTLYEPAFSPVYVKQYTTRSGWLGPYSAKGLYQPLVSSDFGGANFAARVGVAMQMEVYLPDPTSFPGYSLDSRGMDKVFLPAVFIAPQQATSLDQLAAAQPDDPNFVMIGFPAESVPISGHAYSIKGMLWWRSDLLVYSQTQQPTQQTTTVPVFLADGYEELQPAQLQAPATQSVDLELRYVEHGQALTIHRIEWAAGKEVRMLVTLQNLTNSVETPWAGLTTSTASLPQQNSVQGAPDSSPGSVFASISQLDAQQSATGYVTFGPEVSDPHQVLTIRMPPLASSTVGGAGGLIILRVRPQQLVQQPGA